MAREVNKIAIYRKIAEKLNLSEQEVAKAAHSQFSFVAKTMKKGKFESVRLPYFGKFHVNPKRLKHLLRRSNKK